MTRKREPAATAGERSRCNCTSLRKASRRISQLYDSALGPSGLKTTQRSILAELRRSGPATVGGLAEALVMDAGALAHTLKPLERDGLVAIGMDPDDRRTRRVSLTASGRTRLSGSDRYWEQAQHGFEAAFGRGRSDSLREVMRFLVSDEFLTAFEAGASSRGAG